MNIIASFLPQFRNVHMMQIFSRSIKVGRLHENERREGTMFAICSVFLPEKASGYDLRSKMTNSPFYSKEAYAADSKKRFARFA